MRKPSAANIVLLGGGGHAKGVIEAMIAAKMPRPAVILDPNPELKRKKVRGIPVVGADEELPNLRRNGISYFVMGVGSVRDNAPRQKLFDVCLKTGLKPLAVVHPDASVSRSARIGDGSVVFAKAVINADATIGRNVIINTGAIVEHDCVVGDHAHISTGARMGGDVVVGDRVHVGIGATIRQGITIGQNAVVGAGAVAVKNIDAALVVAGVPAAPIKE